MDTATNIVHRKAKCAVLPEFLTLAEFTAFRDFCAARESQFRHSEVVGHEHLVETQYRRSRVLLDTGPFHRIVAGRIKTYLPWILGTLKHVHFDSSHVEAQITASNEGDFFRLHNDSTHADAPTREITYVLFCHREPRPFQGGDLLLYNSTLEAGPEGTAQALTETPSGIGRRITPEQNTCVFFESSCLHEVLPIHCATGAFADSRLTINGWLHREDR